MQMNEMQERFIRVKSNKGNTPKRRLNECGNLLLAKEPGHARTLGRRGAAHVRARYDLQTVFARYVALYESLLERKPVAQRSLGARA
jgi:hypothetical protein